MCNFIPFCILPKKRGRAAPLSLPFDPTTLCVCGPTDPHFSIVGSKSVVGLRERPLSLSLLGVSHQTLIKLSKLGSADKLQTRIMLLHCLIMPKMFQKYCLAAIEEDREAVVATIFFSALCKAEAEKICTVAGLKNICLFTA